MKVVLLAGGFGSRISEESQFKPKPMIEIGGMPILWHIMKEYAYYGHTEFIICAGYKQEYIKDWFANYFLHNSDVTFDYRNGKNDWNFDNINDVFELVGSEQYKEVAKNGQELYLDYINGKKDEIVDHILNSIMN